MPAVVLLAVLSAGCAGSGSTSTPSSWWPFGGSSKKRKSIFDLGWDTPWLLAGGGGWIVTFDSDMESAGGYTIQFGWGDFGGGGIRFMSFDYADKGSGERYETRTLLAYLGGGGALERPGHIAHYGGLGLGVTHVVGEDEEDTGLAVACSYGICKYRNFEGHGGGGLTVEVGLFFAEPGGVPLHGLSLLFGGYLYF